MWAMSYGFSTIAFSLSPLFYLNWVGVGAVSHFGHQYSMYMLDIHTTMQMYTVPITWERLHCLGTQIPTYQFQLKVIFKRKKIM